MTLKLTLFSQEAEDFVMQILLDQESTFYELHKLILKECGYEERADQSFLICDEDWRVKQHVYLTDNGKCTSEEDLYLMNRTTVGEFLEEEGQRLAYIFAPEEKRFFLMELTENIFGHPESEPRVNKKRGEAPAQDSAEEEEIKPATQAASVPEPTDDFLDDEEGFNDDELDMEGFEIND